MKVKHGMGQEHYLPRTVTNELAKDGYTEAGISRD